MHMQRQDYHPKEYLGPHPSFSLEYLDQGFDRPKDLRARRAYGNMQTQPIAAIPVYRIVYDCGQRWQMMAMTQTVATTQTTVTTQTTATTATTATTQTTVMTETMAMTIGQT